MATTHTPPPQGPLVRRGGWALPPQLPETWVGARWTAALVAGMVVATVVPVAVLVRSTSDPSPQLVGLHVAAGLAALLTAYLLLVQASLTGDTRLRWMAAGYALLFVAVLLRAVGVQGPVPDSDDPAALLSRGAGYSLAWQLALPAVALTSSLAYRSLRLVVVPIAAVVGVALVALAHPPFFPDLVLAGGRYTDALRVANGAAAALGLVAAVAWWRGTRAGWHGPWGMVLVGLCLGPVVTGLRIGVDRRYDDLWWVSVVVETAAMVAPAVGLLLVGTSGYFRQSRMWYQLEAEVGALRTATALLPGRSITPDDDSGLPSREEVEALIEARRLHIAVQPVVELGTGRVVGHEALSRFGGRTPTDRWFRAASRYGLGGALEEITLRAALDLLPRLPEDTFLAVNVSPAALVSPTVLELLHGCDLRRIVVEITEHEAVLDYPQARGLLDGMRARGARIAVDDTGAGFASLRHVLLLQPDVIKLDTSITRDVETDVRQRALVLALMSFAVEVGSQVLAEGVETQEQMAALMEIGVPVGQGWHLGLPEILE